MTKSARRFGLAARNRGRSGSVVGLCTPVCRPERGLSSKTVVMLCVEPVVILGLAWTNDLHRLVWERVANVELNTNLYVWQAIHGPASWVHAGYSYLVIGIAMFLLVQTLLRAPRHYRAQIGVLLAGAAVPLVGNLVFTFHFGAFPLDLTPFGLAVSGAIVFWSLLRLRMLDARPVTYNAVIEGPSDSDRGRRRTASWCT